MKTAQIAAQLYTCRDLLQTPADIAKTLNQLRKIGYTAVEVAGLPTHIPTRSSLRSRTARMTICSAHADGAAILDDTASVVERMKTFRCDLAAYPFPGGFDMADPASIGAMVKKLDAAGALLAAEGITLTYHNHAMRVRVSKQMA